MGMNEHEKREEVIKGLECCSVPPKNRYCDSCPIGFGDGCRLKLKRAALTLLKAQEPVSPIQTNGHTGSPIWICGNCKSWIGSKIVSYCWHCGRAVKWE